MGFWNKINEKLEEKQKKSAENLQGDLRLREGATVVIADLINQFVPKKNDSKTLQTITSDLVNIVMSDYNGELEINQILAGKDKEFLPQPTMLAHWAEEHHFDLVSKKENSIAPEDVADKYILTYYPPIARSWAERTDSDIADLSNKHWYSHTKSSIYDSSGQPLGSSNPEAFFNDTEHDATVYVPEDSFSYVIDYKKLGLQKEDIIEGFTLQSQGMNIMDPQIQQSVFRLKNTGMSTDDVVKLWNSGADITNADNLTKIENYMSVNQSSQGLENLDFFKSNNTYQYNLQDRSCAIQPTAPLLYATCVKIERENLNENQAAQLRQTVGLYNIYDEKNYGEINKSFYQSYKKDVMQNFNAAVMENAKKFLKQPIAAAKDFTDNTLNAVTWAGAKTLRWAPQALDIAYNNVKEHIEEQKNSIFEKMKEDMQKFKKIISSMTDQYLPFQQEVTDEKSPSSPKISCVPLSFIHQKRKENE